MCHVYLPIPPDPLRNPTKCTPLYPSLAPFVVTEPWCFGGRALEEPGRGDLHGNGLTAGWQQMGDDAATRIHTSTSTSNICAHGRTRPRARACGPAYACAFARECASARVGAHARARTCARARARRSRPTPWRSRAHLRARP